MAISVMKTLEKVTQFFVKDCEESTIGSWMIRIVKNSHTFHISSQKMIVVGPGMSRKLAVRTQNISYKTEY